MSRGKRAAALRKFERLPRASQKKVMEVVEAEAQAPEMMTDKEICGLLRISPVTLRKHLRQGPDRKRYSNMGDIRLCPHIYIGGKRRWPRAGVTKFIESCGA
jgi:hypothetical protein